MALAVTIVLATPAIAVRADEATPAPARRVTVKARMLGWIDVVGGVYRYRPGSNARMVVVVWPMLPKARVVARLEWRRPGATWRLLETSARPLDRNGQVSFVVRGLPAGYGFRIRARVPPGRRWPGTRSDWCYFRAV
jgi:hypothetical protein